MSDEKIQYTSPTPVSGKSFQHGYKAFTLVEVIVALGLISLMLTGVFGILRQSMDLIENARHYTRVTQVLQSEMERMRSMNWNDLSTMPVWSQFTPQGNFTQVYKDRYTCYRYLYDTYNKAGEQKEVLLICRWQDSKGTTQLQLYRTLFTRKGLNDYYYRAL